MSSRTGLHFEYTAGCLKIRATGRGMIEHQKEAIAEIADAINAQPITALLADLRELIGPYSFMDRFQIGVLAARHLSKTPLAVLALQNQIDKQRIGLLVALNRGTKIELFLDPVAAEAWLKQYAQPSTQADRVL